VNRSTKSNSQAHYQILLTTVNHYTFFSLKLKLIWTLTNTQLDTQIQFWDPYKIWHLENLVKLLLLWKTLKSCVNLKSVSMLHGASSMLEILYIFNICDLLTRLAPRIREVSERRTEKITWTDQLNLILTHTLLNFVEIVNLCTFSY
jgi:hypothetical protein